MPRTVDRDARRAELVDAAQAVFAARGVANTAVSHIVEAAGVAKGTFYLYFDSKDHALVAVAGRVVDGIMDGAEAALDTDASAVDQLRGFIQGLGGFEAQPGVAELAEVLHRPENRALHDRLEERIVPRMVPFMEEIIRRGVAEGAFRVSDPRAAAWFVLGGLRGAELAGTPTAEMPEAMGKGLELAFRTLGHAEPGARPGGAG